MKMFIALMLTLPMISLAKSTDKKVELDATTKVPVKEGYETMDMNQFRDVNKPTASGKSGMNFSTSCRSQSGVEYKTTDQGYDSCLREIQTNNSTSGNQQQKGTQPNMNMHFGN